LHIRWCSAILAFTRYVGAEVRRFSCVMPPPINPWLFPLDSPTSRHTGPPVSLGRSLKPISRCTAEYAIMLRWLTGHIISGNGSRQRAILMLIKDYRQAATSFEGFCSAKRSHMGPCSGQVMPTHDSLGGYTGKLGDAGFRPAFCDFDSIRSIR